MSTLNDNLISYWKLDETSGNAVDSVGGNTGTNTNVTYTDSKIKNGAVYGGTAYHSLGYTGFPTGAGSRTISMWVKPTTLSNSTSYSMFDFGDHGNDGVYQNGSIIVDGSGNKSVFYGGWVIDLQSGTQSITTNTWYHIVFWYNGTTAKIYLNGSEIASASKAWNTSNTHATLGGRRNDVGTLEQPFYGSIDEVGIWSRALTADEIVLIYNRGQGKQYPFYFIPNRGFSTGWTNPS